MPTTQAYYDQLVADATAAATAKKAALDAAYDRLTGATADDTGAISYRKDNSGKPLYGTLDVDYFNRVRQTGAGAESAGMLRSGQYARALAEGQSAYRSAIMGGRSQKEEQKTAVDKDLATELAKYKAMYGDISSGGSSGGQGGSSGSSGSSGEDKVTGGFASPITAPPPSNGISAPPLSGVRPDQIIFPEVGRGGLGSPGTVPVSSVPISIPSANPVISGPRSGQTVLPTTGRGGMGSPGTVVTLPKPPAPVVIKKPNTPTLRPGGKK